MHASQSFRVFTASVGVWKCMNYCVCMCVTIKIQLSKTITFSNKVGRETSFRKPPLFVCFQSFCWTEVYFLDHWYPLLQTLTLTPWILKSGCIHQCIAMVLRVNFGPGCIILNHSMWSYNGPSVTGQPGPHQTIPHD